jgi:hypothetical protein
VSATGILGAGSSQPGTAASPCNSPRSVLGTAEMGRFSQRPSSIKPRTDSLPLGTSDRSAKSRAAAAFVSAKGVRGAAARPLREMAFKPRSHGRRAYVSGRALACQIRTQFLKAFTICFR